MNLFNSLPIYYINLDYRKDRDLNIVNHLKSLGIKNFKRVSAIDGNEYDDSINLSKSEIGCTLSHLKALELFLESNNEYALICEDDVDLSNIFNKKNNIDTVLRSDLDLCVQLAVIMREEMPINFNPHIRSFWDFGTTCYLINRKYAKKIIEFYGSYRNIAWDKFNVKKIQDPRGGEIYTRPVADELIYSLCDVIVFPVVTFFNLNSSINSNEENQRQIICSIEKFYNYWNNYEEINYKDINDIRDIGAIFNNIYSNSLWGFKSGNGSDPENAKEWISNVNFFIKENNIKSILDLGCGDWRISSQLNLKNINYIGIDASSNIIEEIKVNETENIKFICGDIEKIDYPNVDLILIKDVLQHLPNISIQNIVNKAIKSAKYVIACNDIAIENNRDISAGDYRTIDLNKDPFLFNFKNMFQFKSLEVLKNVVFFSKENHDT